MKHISLSKNKKARLRRTFGVSAVTIWAALNYVTNSPLAERIRRMALQNGGRVIHEVDVTSGFLPNCETTFVHGDGGVQRIIHTFSNGVRVEFDSVACRAEISRDGRPEKRFSDVRMRDWGNIVFEAQSLAESLNC